MEGKLNSLVYLYLAEVDPKVRIVGRFLRLCLTIGMGMGMGTTVVYDITTNNDLNLEEKK